MPTWWRTPSPGRPRASPSGCRRERWRAGWIFASPTAARASRIRIRERVFQPFQRLGDSPDGAGVGLGLAVAHGLVEAMGHELIVEDTPGGGTTMVVGIKAAR